MAALASGRVSRSNAREACAIIRPLFRPVGRDSFRRHCSKPTDAAPPPMDFSIASILMLDGATNGAIYALLGLATVLVFAVTRVIFIPQGEFVAYGALTLAMLQMGKVPGTVALLLVMAVMAAALDAVSAARRGVPIGAALAKAARWLAAPVIVAAIAWFTAPMKLPLFFQSLLTLAIVTPLGPLVYRLAYERLADATVLVLLIVSVGTHFAMTGLGLVFFGAEGYRNPSFWDARFNAGALSLSGQAAIIFMVSVAFIVALWLFFERTLRGKALRATAVNRLGARLMGISTTGAGRTSFGLAAFMGALSGLLIGPTTTLFYDSGFLIGLKGFVAAIFGGLSSYPAAAIGALFVGLLESFGSFYASAFKEVIVFTVIIPVLLWRSFQQGHGDEEE
jgi:branched-chain amino acid transport system permease protein